MNMNARCFVGLVITAVLVVCSCGGKKDDGGSESLNIVSESGQQLTDPRDGKTYRVVKIGEQTWMAENLNYRPVPGKSWCYGDDDSNCDKYGRLYDWNTARSACPDGWRLPDTADWNVLENAVGGSSIAGTKLKSQASWNNNGNGTDEYGFSALSGGYRWDGKFYNVGNHGHWWTATEYDGSLAYSRCMYYDGECVYSGHSIKSYGFSVRCVSSD